MVDDMDRIKLGFVPLHRDPFDEGWGRKLRDRTVGALSSVREAEWVYPDESTTKNALVRDDEDAMKVIDLFRAANVSGIVLGTMTFGDEIAGISVAQALRLPILVFGTEEPTITPQGFRSSDSLCGTLSLTSGLYRRKIPFRFAGIVLPEEGPFLDSIKSFARACNVTKGFRGAKVGVIGPRPERFETCTYNEVAMINKFDQRAVPYDLTQVMIGLDGIPERDPEVVTAVEEMRSRAKTDEIDPQNLIKMARLEVLLRRLVKRDRLSAFGFRCWTEIQNLYGISVCHTLGRLTEQGIMSSCESDVYGALTMLMQYLAKFGESVPHFVDWTIKHPERDDLVLMWHCGNAPPCLACEGCETTIRYHSIMYKEIGKERSQGAGEFRLRTGPVTVNRLVEYDGEFKMLTVNGKIVDEGPYTRGSYSWVEIKDFERVYSTLVDEGFIHHASIIHGDISDEIESACKFLGIKTVRI